MEVLVIIGIVLGAISLLCLLAYLMRIIVVWVAKRHGYSADEMPMHYHVIAFGTYFTILIIAHAVYLTTRSM